MRVGLHPAARATAVGELMPVDRRTAEPGRLSHDETLPCSLPSASRSVVLWMTDFYRGLRAEDGSSYTR